MLKIFEALRGDGMRRALVKGISGQDGSYVAELLGKGYEVRGIVRRASSFNTGWLDYIYQDPHESQAELIACVSPSSAGGGTARQFLAPYHHVGGRSLSDTDRGLLEKEPLL